MNILRAQSKRLEEYLHRLISPETYNNPALTDKLKLCAENCEFEDEDNNTLLHFAAEKGIVELAEYFLKNGCNVEAHDIFGFTPLIRAADNPSLPTRKTMVDMLLQAGANPNVMTDTQPAFHRFLDRQDIASAKTFLDFGCDVDKRDKHSYTYLHKAAKRHDLPIVTLLLERGANPNLKTKVIYYGFYKNALHMALMTVRNSAEIPFEVLKILLKYGCNPNDPDETGTTPFQAVVRVGDAKTVRLFLDHEADIGYKHKDGRTALHFAVENKNEAVLRLILEHCDETPDITIMDNQGNTPLMTMLKKYYSSPLYKRVDIRLYLELLIEAGARVDLSDDNHKTILEASTGLQVGEKCVKLEVPQLIVLREVAKLAYLNKCQDRETMFAIYRDCKMQEYFSQCLEEIANMKRYVLTGKITVWDVFVRSDKILTRYYTQRKKFIKKCELIECKMSDLKDIFPIYSEVLLQRFGKYVKKLQDVANLHEELTSKKEVQLTVDMETLAAIGGKKLP